MPESRSVSIRIAILTVAALLAPLALAPCALATMPPAQGPLPSELARAQQEGMTSLPARPSGLPTSVVLPPVWRVPVILVSFTDTPLTYSAAGFDTMLFDTTGATTGSVSEYYRWASARRFAVTGRVVATVHLGHDRFYYANNSFGISRTSTPHNSAGLTLDALLACDASVDWSEFDADRDGYVDMLWVLHAGLPGEGTNDRFDNYLWSITSRLAGYWSSTDSYETSQAIPGTSQHYRVDRFAILPELSYFKPGDRAEIGTFCHEFGHALGLPDLYDTRDGGVRDAGPANWSLMATGGYGGDGHSPEYPTHLGAWPAVFLGWAQVLHPTTDAAITLAPLSGTSLQVLDLSFQGESTADHFLCEVRSRSGFDRNLPGEGLVVYHADEAVIGAGLQSNMVNAQLYPGLIVTEADGNSDLTWGMNRGDPGDPFPGTTLHGNFYDEGPAPNTFTFAGSPTGTGLFDIRLLPQGATFMAQVRARGWQAATDQTVGAYAPTDQAGPVQVAARAPDGTLYSVASEMRSGHLQVILRTRRGGAWDGGMEVSASTGDAFEPAVATLGSDGLVLAWSDTRGGGVRLYYRSMVRGVWSAERVLYGAAGESRGVSIATDARGQVHAAWTFLGTSLPQVLYMRFPYLSPVGQAYPVTRGSSRPSNACVVALPNAAFVEWLDSRTWPPAIWYARCGKDSLPGLPGMLAPLAGSPQTDFSAASDSFGQIHTVWVQSGSTTSELHYQCRVDGAGFVMEDTTLEVSNGTMQHPRIARDSQGGLHLVFERSLTGVPQVRYRRCRPDLRWDASSTDLSTLPDGSAGPIGLRPSVLPTGLGDVTVLYTGYAGSSPRFMQRLRVTDQPPSTAVDDRPGPLALRRGLVYPNPARVGMALEARWAAAAQPGTLEPLDVFDLQGRRVASVALESDGAWLRGRIGPERTRGWTPGIYLVRPRRADMAAQRVVVLR